MSVDLTCNAKDGSLSIADKTNDKLYTGTYKVSDDSPKATTYEIVIDGKSGTAVASVTSYQDGKEIPTMILSVDGYVLSFQSK